MKGVLLCIARRLRSRDRPDFLPSVDNGASSARKPATSPAAARLGACPSNAGSAFSGNAADLARCEIALPGHSSRVVSLARRPRSDFRDRLLGQLRALLEVLILALGLASVAVARPIEGSTGKQSRAFEESIEVEVVNVDVIVTDREGRNVPGLGREQFLLVVDGKPHEIANFDARFRQRDELATFSRRQVRYGDTAALPKHAGEVTWVVYLDLARVKHSQRRLVQRQLHDFLNDAIDSGDPTLVVEFDGVGPRIVSPLGTDKSSALKSIQRVTSNQPRAPFASVDLLDTVEAGLAEEDRFRRLEAALAAADDTLKLARLLETRVAFLFVSGGFDFGQITDALRRARLFAVYQRMLERLREGPVTVYTIFAGSERFSGLGADLFKDQEPDVASLDLSSYGAIATSSEIAAIAEESGGVPFVAATGLGSRLSRLREDLDGYYSIGFHPTGGQRGKSQRIEVRVAREDLKVRHRAARRLSTKQEQARDAGLKALLAANAMDNPWGMSSRIVEKKNAKGGRYRVTVELHVPVTEIAFSHQGSRQRGEVAFHFSVRGPEGWFRFVESQHLLLDLSSDDRERLAREGLRYRIDLIVAGGETSIAGTAMDVATGAYSTVVQPVAAPRGRTWGSPAEVFRTADPVP